MRVVIMNECFKAIKIYETTKKGSKLINILYLKNGQILNHEVCSSNWGRKINEVIKNGYRSKDGLIKTDNPELFLKNMKYLYNGSYIRASDVANIPFEEIQDNLNNQSTLENIE